MIQKAQHPFAIAVMEEFFEEEYVCVYQQELFGTTILNEVLLTFTGVRLFSVKLLIGMKDEFVLQLFRLYPFKQEFFTSVYYARHDTTSGESKNYRFYDPEKGEGQIYQR